MTEPSYVKTTWANTPATSSPINDDNLNHLEQGVSDAIARATASVRYDAAQSLNPTQQALARGNIGVTGSAYSLATKTANYSMTATDQTIIANGTGLTIRLPDPTTVTAGQPFTVKNRNSSTATLNSQGTSKTIDGAASVSIVQWAAYTVVSDGTQWLIV